MSKDSNAVLIIEDEKNLLEKHSKIIESGGYFCIKFASGQKGLEYLSKNKGVIDIVVLDLFMKGLDGLDVLKAIKDNPLKYGDLPVIILTNVSNQSIIKEAFESGASSYLLKNQIENGGLTEELAKYT
jgi:CheY-like chemotaxis protein